MLISFIGGIVACTLEDSNMELDFTHQNEDLINDLYIHDSTFDGFFYNYTKRQIDLVCNNTLRKVRFHFQFNNTLSCYLQSCSFWHGGNSVMDVCVEKNSPQMDELNKLQEQHKEIYEGSYLDRGIIYMQVKFLLNSGDTLLVICENIHFREEMY